MMSGNEVDLDGHAFFRATQPEGVRQINVKLGFGLSATECYIEVGNISSRGRRRQRIVCPTRESRAMLAEMWKEMERVNYRNRPITPVPKPQRSQRRQPQEQRVLGPDDSVECPRCQGNDGDCFLCEGSGEVRAMIAIAWQSNHE